MNRYGEATILRRRVHCAARYMLADVQTRYIPIRGWRRLLTMIPNHSDPTSRTFRICFWPLPPRVPLDTQQTTTTKADDEVIFVGNGHGCHPYAVHYRGSCM